jgi:adenylate cyclase, class 2
MNNQNKYEIEMKFPMPDYGEEKLIRKLENLGAVNKGKYFENNILFDTTNNKLEEKDQLLRLREYKGKYIITFKNKHKGDRTKFKIREEIEIEVSDFAPTIEIFKRIGYNIKLIYQKYRRTMVLDNAEVTIDNLPFGDYIEIEGNKDDINKLSDELKLSITDISNKSYVGLYWSICLQNNITPSPHILFDDYDLSQIIH